MSWSGWYLRNSSISAILRSVIGVVTPFRLLVVLLLEGNAPVTFSVNHRPDSTGYYTLPGTLTLAEPLACRFMPTNCGQEHPDGRQRGGDDVHAALEYVVDGNGRKGNAEYKPSHPWSVPTGKSSDQPHDHDDERSQRHPVTQGQLSRDGSDDLLDLLGRLGEDTTGDHHQRNSRQHHKRHPSHHRPHFLISFPL